MSNEGLKELLEFADDIKSVLEKKYQKVEVNQVIKNNDEMLVAVTVRDESAVAPNIYLNGFYKDFVDNKATVDEISVQIQRIVDESKENDSIKSIDLDIFADKNELKDRVFIKLVGTENNEKYLETAYKVDVADGLVAVFYIMVCEDDNGFMSTKLSKDMYEILDMPLQELYEVARRNTEEIMPARITTMLDVLGSLAPNDVIEDEIPLYVATNIKSVNGATVVLYKGVLKDFCIKHDISELCLIPSSISEMLILPKTESTSLEYLLEMVQEVNSTVLEDRDFLSNHVYEYSVDSDKITLAL